MTYVPTAMSVFTPEQRKELYAQYKLKSLFYKATSPFATELSRREAQAKLKELEIPESDWKFFQ